MDKEKIRHNASVVSKLLARPEKTHWTFYELLQASKLNEKELCTAIGWLSGKDAIEMRNDLEDKDGYFFISNPLYF